MPAYIDNPEAYADARLQHIADHPEHKGKCVTCRYWNTYPMFVGDRLDWSAFCDCPHNHDGTPVAMSVRGEMSTTGGWSCPRWREWSASALPMAREAKQIRERTRLAEIKASEARPWRLSDYTTPPVEP